MKLTKGITGILIGICLMSVGITTAAVLYAWRMVKMPQISLDHHSQKEEEPVSFLERSAKLLKPLVNICPSQLSDAEVANVLVAGVDGILVPGRESTTYRTDSIHLVRLFPKSKHAVILSVPRDLRVRLGKRHGYDKINAAFVYGKKDLLVESVEELFSEGEVALSMDKVLVLNLDAFIHVVDEFGGVEIDVEKRMKYKDNWGGLNIDLHPGLQRLNGTQAMGYVRFRKDRQGDLGRIVRQQKFAAEFVKQTSGFGNRIKLKRLFDELVKDGDLDTDMGFCDFLAMKNAFSGNDLDHRLIPVPLPVADEYISGISYLIPIKSGVRDIINKVFSQTGPYSFLENEPLKLVNSCDSENRGNFLKSLLRANGIRFSASERKEADRPKTTTVYGEISPEMQEKMTEFFPKPVSFLPYPTPEPSDLSASEPVPEPQTFSKEPTLVLGSDVCRAL